MNEQEKELQGKMMNYRMLEAKLESLIKQREAFVAKMGELISVLDSFDEIEKGDEILFSLGGDAYTVGRIMDKKSLFVDVGSGILLKKTVEDGKTTLGKRKDDLEKAVNELQKEIMSTSSLMENINAQIQKAYQNSS